MSILLKGRVARRRSRPVQEEDAAGKEESDRKLRGGDLERSRGDPRARTSSLPSRVSHGLLHPESSTGGPGRSKARLTEDATRGGDDAALALVGQDSSSDGLAQGLGGAEEE